jgi:Domain of unknown function (DUF6438)
MKSLCIPLLLFFMAIFSGLACKSSKKSADGGISVNSSSDWVLRFDRGPCFGQCPVYTFYLLSDYSGLIEVKANLLEPGWYQANLDQEAVHEIIMDIEPESWWNDDLSDEPEIADLPFTQLAYKHQDGLRFLEVRNKLSHQTGNVFQKVGHLVQEARWVPTTNRPKEPDIQQPTDIIVQLKEGVDVQQWMKKFESFGMQLKKKVAPRLSYYVVSMKPGSYTPSDFLQAIKADADVVDAQWDKPLTSRGQ